MTTTRRLAAILAADVAGYSRLMAADEVATLAALKAARREVIDPAIAEHHGRIVKTTGDGMLVEFPSIVDAVTCAADVQAAMVARDGALSFRIGINIGDIIIDGDDIFGDGVNVAARVEGECEPGSVSLSAAAYDQVRNKTKLAFDDLGERSLKNIDRPVRIYALRPAGAVAATVSMPEPGKPLPLPDKPSIAVLPFQNMSGDPEQEYFADGMVEDITTALSRFKSLFVIARNSSFTYKGKAVDIKQVGRELGVRYVLEGSVRKAGGRVRITGQLIEATTGSHLWADRFDGAVDDVFDLQDSVVTKVVSAIAPKVERAEIERARRKPTERMDCYDYFLQGMSLKYRRMPHEAFLAFKEAFDRDPNYSAAYAEAAHTLMFSQSIRGARLPSDIRTQAIHLARKAVDAGRDDAHALARAAHVIAYLGLDCSSADALVDEAISVNPNLAVAWLVRGWVSVIAGRGEASLKSFEHAVRLSPVDPLIPFVWYGMACAYNAAGRYQEGCEAAVRAMQVPEVHSLGCFIINAVPIGRMQEARDAADQLRTLQPDFSVSRMGETFRTQDPDWASRMAAAFRAVGIPE